MALFARSSSTPDTPPDSAFPFWSQSVGDEFRGMVRSAFAEAGSEVTIHSDHVVDARGTQFELANLAATFHNEERGKRAWPQTIGRHVRSIVASAGKPDEFDEMSDAEVLRSTYCRVIPSADLVPIITYGQDVPPGIVRVFDLDRPETVQYFTDDKVARFGEAALVDAGMRNLRTLQADVHETLEHAGGTLEMLLGESVFTASLILVLDEVVAGYGHHIDLEIGAFVAIPYRNQLDWRGSLPARAGVGDRYAFDVELAPERPQHDGSGG